MNPTLANILAFLNKHLSRGFFIYTTILFCTLYVFMANSTQKNQVLYEQALLEIKQLKESGQVLSDGYNSIKIGMSTLDALNTKECSLRILANGSNVAACDDLPLYEDTVRMEVYFKQGKVDSIYIKISKEGAIIKLKELIEQYGSPVVAKNGWGEKQFRFNNGLVRLSIPESGKGTLSYRRASN